MVTKGRAFGFSIAAFLAGVLAGVAAHPARFDATVGVLRISFCGSSRTSAAET
jgi:hypothetical protein